MYSHSVEQSREQSVSVQTLQEELARTRANHETELRECHDTFQQQIQEKDDELARARANHQIELNDYRTKLQKKCDELNESEMEQLKCRHMNQRMSNFARRTVNSVRNKRRRKHLKQHLNVNKSHRKCLNQHYVTW